MDRPSRKTKTVNYCEAKDFDDDDDFAGAKAPPSKKAREDAKREQGKSSSQKSRRPPDERQRERDLEAAITLATLNDANPEPTCGLGLDEIAPGSLCSSRRSEEAAAEGQRETRPDEDEDHKPGPTPGRRAVFPPRIGGLEVCKVFSPRSSKPENDDDDEESAKKTVTENEQSERRPASAKEKRPSESTRQAAGTSWKRAREESAFGRDGHLTAAFVSRQFRRRREVLLRRPERRPKDPRSPRARRGAGHPSGRHQVKSAEVPIHPGVRQPGLRVRVCAWDCPARFESSLFTPARRVGEGRSSSSPFSFLCAKAIK